MTPLTAADNYRVPVQLVAGMDIGDVHLEDRALEYLHGVEDRDRGEGVAGGIDDQRVGAGARGLDQIDQHALMIGLLERQFGAGKGSEFLAGLLDRIERGRAVDMRLPDAEHVQVRSVEDHDAHVKSFREREYDWLSRRTISPAR